MNADTDPQLNCFHPMLSTSTFVRISSSPGPFIFPLAPFGIFSIICNIIRSSIYGTGTPPTTPMANGGNFKHNKMFLFSSVYLDTTVPGIGRLGSILHICNFSQGVCNLRGMLSRCHQKIRFFSYYIMKIGTRTRYVFVSLQR